MKEQILKIMEAEGLTPAKFADEIGVQRSSISHIISGRNKPSYDFIMKIVERFRGINTDWLLTGKGSMIKSSGSDQNEQKVLFDSSKKEDLIKKQDEEKVTIENQKKAITQAGSSIETIQEKYRTGKQTTNQLEFTDVNNEKYVLVFFEDGTYKKFTPRK